METDFAEPITNGNTVFRTDATPSYRGVKDKNGNVVIDAIYNSLEGNADNTYFYFELNDARGVLNDKGEIIIKGLDYYTDYIFYPENIVLYTNPLSLYSLPSGELVGEYEHIYDFDNKTFLVTGFDENDNPYAKIIDSKGNQIADLLSDSPIPADQISGIQCLDVPYEYYNIEIPFIEIALASKNGDWSHGIFNKKGEKIDGLNQVPRWSYGVDYLYSGIVTNSLRSDDNGWLTNVYDYSGKKLGSFETTSYLNTFNGKVFKEEDSNVFLRADGTKIGEFSNYSSEPYRIYDSTKGNWSNAIIVTDADGMFKGVIIGDELKYPCEYTDIKFVDDSDSISGDIIVGRCNLLMLQKGSETIYITALTGAVVDLPQ
ncbi:MAG: hypothetical protein LBL87_03540 [Ruminococcus sp.]|nr:hypothetical protein [Ruminococcus sp.]